MDICRSMACSLCSYNSIGYSDTSVIPPSKPLSSRLCCSSTSLRMFFTLLRLLWSVWNMYLGSELSRCEFIMASLWVCFKPPVPLFEACGNGCGLASNTGESDFSECWSRLLMATWSFMSSSDSHVTLVLDLNLNWFKFDSN